MSTENELTIRTRQRDWWMQERNRLLKRLMNIVTEDGKFAYGTPARCLDVVEHVFASYRRMANNLQTVVQKYHIGNAGMPVDEIVCAELEKFMRFPPPVDNEFVAPGCEKFGAAVALGRLGGKANTAAQNAARKRNGKLGGRPKQVLTMEMVCPKLAKAIKDSKAGNFRRLRRWCKENGIALDMKLPAK